MVVHIIESEIVEFLFKLKKNNPKPKNNPTQSQGTLSCKPNMFRSFKAVNIDVFTNIDNETEGTCYKWCS